MAHHQPAPAPNYHRTEQFLLGQDGVLDARCWHKKEKLIGWVTVSDMEGMSPAKLQMACLKTLGPELTPDLIVFIQEKVEPEEAVA